MKLAVNMQLPSGSVVVHDGKDISDDDEGWVHACQRAPEIGNSAIKLFEVMNLVNGKGYTMRKVAREGTWTAWREHSRYNFVVVKLIEEEVKD